MERDDYEKVPLEARNDSDEWTATGAATPLVPSSETEPRKVSGDNSSASHKPKRKSSQSVRHTTRSASPSCDFMLWAARPVAVLVVQLIFLIGMLSFAIWTSIAPRQVPHLVSSLSQSIITVHTLIGSTLSLMNAMLFAEAIRFAIHVSLRIRGLSLYSLSAATSIASRTLLFSFDSARIKWTVMSIICIIVFTAQTSAWTTIITPRRTVLSQYPGVFLDVNFTSDSLMNGSTVHDFSLILFQSSSSGMAAALYAATGSWSTLQYFPYLLADGTSRGILLNPIFAFPSNNKVQVTGFQTAANDSGLVSSPNAGLTAPPPNVSGMTAKVSTWYIPARNLVPRDSESTGSTVYGSTVPAIQTQNWAKIETRQQGLSANVSCTETSANDLALNISANPSSAFGRTFTETILYCTNNASGTELNSSAIFDQYVTSYMAFVVCPYWNMSNPSDNITLYMRIGVDKITPNNTIDVTCNIKPQLLNVTTVYGISHVVTTNSSTIEAPVDLAINKSSVVHAVISALEDNLSSVQSSDRNMVVDALYSLYVTKGYQSSPNSKRDNDLSPFFNLLAWYIRGVIEDASTELRSSLVAANLTVSDPIAIKVPLEASVPIMVWGQIPSFKLLIILAPLLIMLTTISLIVFSLYRAWKLGLKLDKAFNPMNTIHIVAACSFGDLQTISFPGYSEDISVFSSGVDVQFPKGRARSNTEGFHFSRRMSSTSKA